MFWEQWVHRRRIGTVNSDVIGVARALAAHAHKVQRDKMSRDYFDAHLVPIASAASVFGDDVEAAAWLHDWARRHGPHIRRPQR